MDKNLLRKRAYENRKNALESLPAEYSRPLMKKEEYEIWRKNYKVDPPKKLSLLKLLIIL